MTYFVNYFMYLCVTSSPLRLRLGFERVWETPGRHLPQGGNMRIILGLGLALLAGCKTTPEAKATPEFVAGDLLVRSDEGQALDPALVQTALAARGIQARVESCLLNTCLVKLTRDGQPLTPAATLEAKETLCSASLAGVNSVAVNNLSKPMGEP